MKKKKKNLWQKIIGKIFGPLYVMDMGVRRHFAYNRQVFTKIITLKKHWVCDIAHDFCHVCESYLITLRHAIANGNILYKILLSGHYNPSIIFLAHDWSKHVT